VGFGANAGALLASAPHSSVFVLCLLATAAYLAAVLVWCRLVWCTKERRLNQWLQSPFIDCLWALGRGMV
jgi:hypothetical protein